MELLQADEKERYALTGDEIVLQASEGVSPLVFNYSGMGISEEGIFDIAEVLSQAAPRDNLIMPEYMSSEFDAHPNGRAGSAVASAFLAWY